MTSNRLKSKLSYEFVSANVPYGHTDIASIVILFPLQVHIQLHNPGHKFLLDSETWLRIFLPQLLLKFRINECHWNIPMKHFLIFSECWTDRLDYCLDEEDKLAVLNTQNFLWTDANTWTLNTNLEPFITSWALYLIIFLCVSRLRLLKISRLKILLCMSTEIS